MMKMSDEISPNFSEHQLKIFSHWNLTHHLYIIDKIWQEALFQRHQLWLSVPLNSAMPDLQSNPIISKTIVKILLYSDEVPMMSIWGDVAIVYCLLMGLNLRGGWLLGDRCHQGINNLVIYLNFLYISLTHCGVMMSGILVKIGSGNGLLPDGIKPLPAPMLTYHQWGSVALN